MIHVNDLLDLIDDVFRKSAVEAFEKFWHESGQPSKWFVVSDYCLHDQGKPNDCFSFTLVPFDADFFATLAKIDQVSPNDLKSIKAVSPEMISLLRDGTRFQVCFVVERERKLFADGQIERERDGIRLAIQNTISMMERWTDPPAHPEALKAMRRFKRDLKGNFNVNLFTDLFLASVFAAELSHILETVADAEIVSWFSDRDNIIGWIDGIAYTLYHLNLHALREKRGTKHTAKVVVSVPSPALDGNNLWYDAAVRVADFFAGAVASYDLDRNLVESKQKHLQLIEQVLAGNDRLAILRIRFAGENIECVRVTITTAAQTAPSLDAPILQVGQ